MRLESPRAACSSVSYIKPHFRPLSLCFDTRLFIVRAAIYTHSLKRGHPSLSFFFCVRAASSGEFLEFLRSRAASSFPPNVLISGCDLDVSPETPRSAWHCTQWAEREAARFRARIPATHAIMHKINREFYCESLLWWQILLVAKIPARADNTACVCKNSSANVCFLQWRAEKSCTIADLKFEIINAWGV